MRSCRAFSSRGRGESPTAKSALRRNVEWVMTRPVIGVQEGDMELTPTPANVSDARALPSAGLHASVETSSIKRLLVPTSGMPNAEGALTVARRLAQRTGASVELLAVFEPRIPPPMTARAQPAPRQCEEQDRCSAAELLRRVRRQRRRLAPTARWPMRFEVGFAPFVIAQVARETKADLIVLGIGRSYPAARRMGSETALRVAHYGDVPVLAVARDAARPLRKALMVAAGESKGAAIRVACAVLERPAQLWIAYPHDRLDRAPLSSAAICRAALGTELSIPAGVELRAADAAPADAGALIRFAEQHQIDLMVMPVRGTSFGERQLISNIVVPILRASRCSVLAVPEPQCVRCADVGYPPAALGKSSTPFIPA
jgi:nucleotide-binding universal stress UspA family protein